MPRYKIIIKQYHMDQKSYQLDQGSTSDICYRNNDQIKNPGYYKIKRVPTIILKESPRYVQPSMPFGKEPKDTHSAKRLIAMMQSKNHNLKKRNSLYLGTVGRNRQT